MKRKFPESSSKSVILVDKSTSVSLLHHHDFILHSVVNVVDVGVAVIVAVVVRPAPVGGEGVWDEPEGAGVAACSADGLVLGGHGAREAPRAAALHADAELLAAVGLG